MTSKTGPRKARKSSLRFDVLENRNLMTASRVDGIRAPGIGAVFQATIESPRRTRIAEVSGALTHGDRRNLAAPLAKSQSHRPTYDIAIHFAYVGDPGNASIPINGFTPPSRATVPAKVPQGDEYQNLGGVPYVYAIGQTEITAGQYVTFLNKVDPNGENPVMPYTGVTLWNSQFSPVVNPFSGEINLVTNAAPGTHYQLAASYWANKPLVNGNLFDFAYFVNSLYNGTTVAVDNKEAKSPVGIEVHLQTRYVNLSTNIMTGMYDLEDSSYPFFERLNTSGYVIPSENEWIKAAYYSPFPTGNGTHYYYYPTTSNNPPTALTTGGAKPTVDSVGNVILSNLTPGVAYSNYNQDVIWQPPYDPEPATGTANVVNVGEDRTPSPWLTYDQGGNAVEYTDTVATPVTNTPNPNDPPVDVKVHGGIANAGTYQLWITATGTSSPYGQQLGQVITQGGARFGYVPGPSDPKVTRTLRRVSQSGLASPFASEGVVYRLDNLNTLSTFYTTNLTQAITMENSHSGYVFLSASFQQSASAGAKPVYGFLNTTTRTQFYTMNPTLADATAANSQYVSEGVVFHALPPRAGATNYRIFYNSQTDAYAYSAATADIQFFTSRGYQFEGYAWSVS